MINYLESKCIQQRIHTKCSVFKNQILSVHVNFQLPKQWVVIVLKAETLRAILLPSLPTAPPYKYPFTTNDHTAIHQWWLRNKRCDGVCLSDFAIYLSWLRNTGIKHLYTSQSDLVKEEDAANIVDAQRHGIYHGSLETSMFALEEVGDVPASSPCLGLLLCSTSLTQRMNV